jgi:U3 small nucleolar ribonucleoprotein protein IMP3
MYYVAHSSSLSKGHIRVGDTVIKDPAYLVFGPFSSSFQGGDEVIVLFFCSQVTRPLEDFVTWVDSSKIKQTIAKYNDKLDDYDLLGL